ncbi:MAG: DUF2085 domain-containing protein [Calditrichia bacterium]
MNKNIKSFGKSLMLTSCHRLPERSFFFRGKQLPLCARCSGLLVGCLTYPFFIFDILTLPLSVLLFLHLPLVIDGTTQALGKRLSTNGMRLITGIMAGVSQVGVCNLLALKVAFFFNQFI